MREKAVRCDETMRKEQLIKLLDIHRPKEKTFTVSMYMFCVGHTVTVLPPCMCDLNAVELFWPKIKHYDRENKIVTET